MPIGDWTPPAGWTWSDSGGWLPPSDVPEIERLRAENARLETMLQGEIFVRDNLLEALGHEKDLRAENERLRAALELVKHRILVGERFSASGETVQMIDAAMAQDSGNRT